LRLNSKNASSIAASAGLNTDELPIPLPKNAAPSSEQKASITGGAWNLEHWFGAFIVLVTGWAIWSCLPFEANARFLPLLTAGTTLALTLYLLIFDRRSITGQIMDIGLRSLTIPGAGRTALIITGFVGLLIFLTALIGLKYACILFAVLFPIVMMEGNGRWITSAVGGVLVAAIAIGLLDIYMNVFWPAPVLWGWIMMIF
jgi:hypothetical protein